ncbi:hypothetical protein IAD21_00751 [Abditibacteriota bacterium]|nr:hypothetical protein IAD21_00751 [Abditibacteriota bacterium]
MTTHLFTSRRLVRLACGVALATAVGAPLTAHGEDGLAANEVQTAPELTQAQKDALSSMIEALAKARAALDTSAQLVKTAGQQNAALKPLANFKHVDQAALTGMKALSVAYDRLGVAGTFGKLADASSLTDAQEALKPFTPPVDTDPKEIKDAYARVESARTLLGKALAMQSDAHKAMQDRIEVGVNAVKDWLMRLDDEQKPVTEMAAPNATPNAVELRETLADNLVGFANTISLLEPFDTVWADMGQKIMDIDADAFTTPIGQVNDARDAIQQKKQDVLEKLPSWFDSLSADAQSQRRSNLDKLPELLADPKGQLGSSQSLIKGTQGELKDLNELRAGWLVLAAQLEDKPKHARQIAVLKTASEALYEDTANLAASKNILEDAIGGSHANETVQSVSLYYFTDVPRLMQILNPDVREEGGDPSAKAKAEVARLRLGQAEIDLVNAQQAVNDVQPRIVAIRNERASAKGLLADIVRRHKSSSRILEDLKAQTAVKADVLKRAQRADDDRQAEEETANAEVQRLDGEQATLDGLMAELERAQNAVNSSRMTMQLAVEAESKAFASSRSKTPFLFAPAIAASDDPVRKVRIYGFRDSKTIFLRGNQDDVDRAVEIIANFDRPAPQARLTLWTLQMSGSGNKQGLKNFNAALQHMEGTLATTRGQMTDSVTLLRECVNEEVNRIAQRTVKSELPAPLNADSIKLFQTTYARWMFYSPEVLRRLGVTSDHITTKQTTKTWQDSTVVGRSLLPDPAGTTTLGETLLVLSLSSPETQKNVWEHFQAKYNAAFNKPKTAPVPCFLSLRRQLWIDQVGLDPLMGPPTASNIGNPVLTPAQREITDALVQANLPQMKKRVRALVEEMILIAEDIKQPGPVDPARLLKLRVIQKDNFQELMTLANWFVEAQGLQLSYSIKSLLLETDPVVAAEKLRDQYIDRSARYTGEDAVAYILGPLSDTSIDRAFINGRIAAADEMLKRMITAAEDDLDRQFISPSINDLRTTLANRYVNVGIVGRTSMLATNRSLSRVDPRASAQLEIGPEEDVLGATQQLAQLIVSSQTGGVLGGLSALGGVKREGPPELYGITSGATFEVTPIFDPSGQALRFQFDYAQNNFIQGPNRTVNPQLPRIERHTINTEVQLSNLELREVSRFEANSKLGVPKKNSGGIPILRDLPILRSLPLIGWFSRRKGSAGAIQESVVFAQTTMYPTIGDIVNLLRQPDSPLQTQTLQLRLKNEVDTKRASLLKDQNPQQKPAGN